LISGTESYISGTRKIVLYSEVYFCLMLLEITNFRMKNQLRIITLLLALTIMPHGHAQTLREQFQQKKDELLGGGGAASESEMPTEGQLEIATKWESDENI